MILHGSGGGPIPDGDRVGDWWVGECSGDLKFDAGPQSQMYMAVTLGGDHMRLRPNDRQQRADGQWLQSQWSGWSNGDGVLNLYTDRRLVKMLQTIAERYPQGDTNNIQVSGQSMGGWAAARLAVRHGDLLTACFAWQPRWRSASAVGLLEIVDWPGGGATRMPFDAAPTLAAADGGGPALGYFDNIAGILDPTRVIPWIGFAIGANDQYVPWVDTLQAHDALRAMKRPFAFAWNQGDHGTPPSMQEIETSYALDRTMFRKGVPYLSGSSRDKDPHVDPAGGVNLGFYWRNVVETATSWSCQLTNTKGATTVTVEPCSTLFPRGVRSADPVAAKTVTTVPGSWVTVSFTA
jgi:pimeloyl-ACP methyl ester carboxylesterase